MVADVTLGELAPSLSLKCLRPGRRGIINDKSSSPVSPPNFTLKLVRPGFGPGLKPLHELPSVAGVTPADILSRRIAARTWQPSRRASFGTRALAAQLSVRTLAGRNVGSK